ncbi:hypothetical protein N5P37_004552 [Trichoderma harzianum]|uniref:Fucose-specific lectin n=2 Tax=Trichoderma TaxID=5543 RepID=A0A2T3ZSN5_TRIHA|nr:hypothetical protein M431DRAFT_366985 [Trichoderma harzianum CBS 226.95]KAK0761753.1 hypothetical protein N5P37_004552 [Trichoderma harzianum]OPB41138.1 hypothetical protein A0O28_0108350 [Trichoderma guizhouense]PKK47263.1 hypothetical protein CI102_8448 [Trichoderma harzianum]PTB47822.1 hypothetical protein M431DRAFT_366985 [Trichoderma harzianum CBS 226.95]
MAALAAIYNPSAPKDRSVSLFFNTSTAQVALSLMNGTEGNDNNDIYACGDDDYPGYILNPSEIAGGTYRGIQHVVATTVPIVEKGASVTKNQISLISPVYKKLNTTALANKNVSFSADNVDKHAWAYFLDGSANYQTALKEYDFLSGSTAKYLDHADIRVNSSLAAYYNIKNKHRFVIYQEVGAGNHLKEFDITSGQTYDIQNSVGAAPGTTIAVTYDQGGNKAYVYYYDTDATIRRIVKTGADQTASWSPSVPVENAVRISVPGQLTVSTANGLNHLFYVSVDNSLADNDFTHVTDPLDE